MSTALQMHQVTMRFPTCTALDNVDFSLELGEIHALVGEHDAGKSTLAHVFAGLYLPSEGSISLFGTPFDPHQQHKKQTTHPIGLVHQKSILIPQLTVAQNITLGAEPKKAHFFGKNPSRTAALAISQQYGLALDVDATVASLDNATALRVSIAKCLHRQAQVLILDDPTLSSQEMQDLGPLLTQLTAMGKSILLITHNVKDVLPFSQRITILRAGSVAETMLCNQTTTNAVTTAMTGHPLSGRSTAYATQTPMVVFEDVSYKNSLSRLSFTLYHGEVLAIVGAAHQGQTELVQLMAGFIQASKGKITLDGLNIAQFSPTELMDYGVNFIAPPAPPKKFDFSGLQSQLFGFHAPSIYQKGLTKAQQNSATITKQDAPNHGSIRLFVAHQPYGNMDASAIAALHHTFHQACKDGKSVLLTAMELEPILLIADRIAIIHHGTIVDTVDAHLLTTDTLASMIEATAST